MQLWSRRTVGNIVSDHSVRGRRTSSCQEALVVVGDCLVGMWSVGQDGQPVVAGCDPGVSFDSVEPSISGARLSPLSPQASALEMWPTDVQDAA